MTLRASKRLITGLDHVLRDRETQATRLMHRDSHWEWRKSGDGLSLLQILISSAAAKANNASPSRI